MHSDDIIYTVELICDYPEWWRYNIYIMAVGRDSEGNTIGFSNFADKVMDVSVQTTGRTMPADYARGNSVCLFTDPCHHADIYVYIIANTFPPSEVICDSPSFPLLMRVMASGGTISEQLYEVNQWGGLTIVAHRAGPVGE